MTRGFCTIATGDFKYSKLAYNLLMSYKRFAKNPYPFCVITDKKNELLDKFDDVILISETEQSYVDKLLLFKLCPYDETLFIDADSLAYGDLCDLFKYFEYADDVSCVGEVLDKESIHGWFRYEDIGDYKKRVNYTIWMHGGIYFIRKTPQMLKFYNTCKEIEKIYKTIFFRFKYLIEPADEPIVALAMAVHGFKPIKGEPEIMAFYRDSKIKKIDIISGALSYKVKLGETDAGYLVHWATANTERALYGNEEKKIEWIVNKKRGFSYQMQGFLLKTHLYYYYLKMYDLFQDKKKLRR